MNPEFLTPAQVQESLGFGKSKVYAMLKDGTLPSIRIGKSVRVDPRALQRWVAELPQKEGRTPASSAETAKAAKVPLNVALREILSFMEPLMPKSILPEARLAIAFDLLALAANQGWVGLWEREAA